MEDLDTAALNETLHLLTHPHRRYVLYYLLNESGTVGIDTLAAAIAWWDPGHPGADRRVGDGAIQAALHHTHLPKLADAGIVSFDTGGDSVELAETDGLDRILDDTARIDGYEQAVSDD